MEKDSYDKWVESHFAYTGHRFEKMGAVLLENPSDQETATIICAAFKRNLRGGVSDRSQYGFCYDTIAVDCPVAFEAALGTLKANETLRHEALRRCQALAKDFPVAVWRIWPTIERTDTGTLHLYMRLHIMTEAHFQQFAQQERD